MKTLIRIVAGICCMQLLLAGCKKDSTPNVVDPPVIPPVTPAFDINSINDNYATIAPFANYQSWGSHNVHDPAIIKDGDYYYCYNTDVGYGIDVRPGIQFASRKIWYSGPMWDGYSMDCPEGVLLISAQPEVRLSMRCGRPVS